MKTALIVLTAVLAFGSARATTTSKHADTTSAFKTHAAPAFELKDLDGKAVKLSDFAGKVVVLNFFATWCPPCRWEIPQFNELQKKYGAEVQFLGVSLDEEGAEKVKEWKTKHPVEYPVLMTDPDRKILDTYDVKSAIPVTFVIDRQGVVQMEYTPKRGDTPGAIIETAVKPLLTH